MYTESIFEKNAHFLKMPSGFKPRFFIVIEKPDILNKTTKKFKLKVHHYRCSSNLVFEIGK